MKDQFAREIDYVRISVTDRCNLRCRYCMPAEGVPLLAHGDVLRFEEIERVVRVLAGLGVRRVRLTGGEPLCRRDLPALAALLSAVDGIEELALTTNGLLLPDLAQKLYDAGVSRVNISMDSLQPARYAAITRGGDWQRAYEGIRAARAAGMQVKINAVPVVGFNDDEIMDFIRFGQRENLLVRFIELMPIGMGAGLTGLSEAQVLQKIAAEKPGFQPDAEKRGSGPAACYSWADGSGFGVIGAVHDCFCASCNRVRLTADGLLRLCLGQPDALDLKPYLRGAAEGMEQAIEAAVYRKPAGHSFLSKEQKDRTMNQIGG